VSEKTLEVMLTSYMGQWPKRTQLTTGAQHLHLHQERDLLYSWQSLWVHVCVPRTLD